MVQENRQPPPVASRTTHAPVINTAHSRQARLCPVGPAGVRLKDDFWAPRRDINRLVTLPSQYEQCEATGRLDNFRRAAGRYSGPFQGFFFNDSDVYKWLEAAAWMQATDPSPELAKLLDEVARLVVAAQDEDGYLNTYFTFERKAERWTNLKDMHELYCAGHFIQAAVAHHRATGESLLLDAAIRLANHIASVFGPAARRGACGHPEIEMALVELARETDEQRYVALAQFFVDQRGQQDQQPPLFGGHPYYQDHAPFRQQQSVAGHAVRALYLYAGATDIYLETGEEALKNAVDALWQDLYAHQVYITGGVGSRYEGEAFGEAYELPDRRAYSETCAAIASVLWNLRLLQFQGEARYADVLETALYNGVLAGISLDGTHYFYQNPLADSGQHRRLSWFSCACCPPNIARTLAALPGYFYSTSREGIWIHLYASSDATVQLSDGRSVALRQQTGYPWDGEISLALEVDAPATFSLFLRIPGWSDGATLQVNEEAFAGQCQAGSYVELHRQWQSGDHITLSLPMPVHLVESHPHVLNHRGRVAIMRGPLVYCLEQADHQGVHVWDIALEAGTTWEARHQPELLGGVTTLHTGGWQLDTTTWKQRLYRPFRQKSTSLGPLEVTAIPYYAWANRAPGPMQVWLPIEQ